MNRLRIGQINARHSEVVWALLDRIVIEENIDVLLVQEPPWTVSYLPNRWGGYQVFAPTVGGSDVSGALVAIVARVSLGAEACGPWSERVCGISLDTSAGTLLCVSAYLQPGTGRGLDALSELLEVTRE